MEKQIVVFGIQAQLNVIELEQGLGTLKELVFTCTKEVSEKIIKEAVKRGFPFEKTSDGCKVFN